MNIKLLMYYGSFSLIGILGGLLLAEIRKTKCLEGIIKERDELIEEYSNLIDETLSLYKERTESQDEVIREQEKVIEKLDPELGKKLKSLNFKVLKNELGAE